jgi:regulator of replication initiation timing
MESESNKIERREGFQVLSEQLRNMHQDLSGVKAALTKLTDAVSHLAVVDERLSQNTSNVTRLQLQIDSMDLRVRALELSVPYTNKVTSWVERFVIAVVTAAIITAITWRRE